MKNVFIKLDKKINLKSLKYTDVKRKIHVLFSEHFCLMFNVKKKLFLDSTKVNFILHLQVGILSLSPA